MKRILRPAVVATATALCAAAVVAHVRLINPGNGNPLYWQSPGNIGIVINSTGSDNIPDDSDELAIRMAIQDWNDVTGTTATLVEDTSPASQARTDFGNSNIHLILFDENNSSGYFPGSSSTVAVTPIWFFSNGRISDADILFNGSNFSFTTSQQMGRFDVQDVAAHELGHLLGLDHSGWAGSTMYPYVDPTVILHRSLSEDEARGLRHMYPQGASGRITGTIERLADGTPVAGAHVVARDADGRSAGGILSDVNGNFTLQSLDPGTYTVYATPLDEPVAAANLGGGHTIEIDFEPAVYGATATITATETVALGTLLVDPDVLLNVGQNNDNYPMRIVDGSTTNVTLRGTGLFNGATLTVSDPDLTVGAAVWAGSQVTFPVTVPDGEARGHVDVTVVNGFGDVSILPAALEVTPPSPTVASVTPSTGPTGGGTAITIFGTNFASGSRVVLGDQIYVDGAPGGCNVVNATAITLTTAATVGGMHDVVVIDPSGVEGRRSDGFHVQALPTISTVFPSAGDAAGGTQVAVTGQDFVAGLVVRIDGVLQSNVTLEGSTTVRFDTVGGAAGGPYVLEIENPDMGLANSAFTYAAQADPDPALVDPSTGQTGGGKTVVVSGSGFTATSEVYFGVDPDTGVGGTLAPSINFVDGSTLEVMTPAHAQGLVAVMVSDPATGQSGVLTGGFQFNSPGGSGGGCYMVPVPPVGGDALRSALLGGWWLAALAAFVLLRRRAVDPVRV